MSGGSLNYFYCQLEDHVGDFGDKELDNLVGDLAELFYARERYLSSDTGVGEWNEARDAFKSKWFTEYGRQERIEQYLDELGKEVREMLGIQKSYCKTCKHWTPGGIGSSYGNCELESRVAMHRYENCKKWEGRDYAE